MHYYVLELADPERGIREHVIAEIAAMPGAKAQSSARLPWGNRDRSSWGANGGHVFSARARSSALRSKDAEPSATGGASTIRSSRSASASTSAEAQRSTHWQVDHREAMILGHWSMWMGVRLNGRGARAGQQSWAPWTRLTSNLAARTPGFGRGPDRNLQFVF
jgi:hypothetical protein